MSKMKVNYLGGGGGGRILPDNQIAAASQSQYFDQQLDDPEPMTKQLQIFVLPFE